MIQFENDMLMTREIHRHITYTTIIPLCGQNETFASKSKNDEQYCMWTTGYNGTVITLSVPDLPAHAVKALIYLLVVGRSYRTVATCPVCGSRERDCLSQQVKTLAL